MEVIVTLTPGMYRIEFQNHPVVIGMGIKKIELHDCACIKESKLLGQKKNLLVKYATIINVLHMANKPFVSFAV